MAQAQKWNILPPVASNQEDWDGWEPRNLWDCPNAPIDGKWALWCDTHGNHQIARYKNDCGVEKFAAGDRVFPLCEAAAWMPIPWPEDVDKDPGDWISIKKAHPKTGDVVLCLCPSDYYKYNCYDGVYDGAELRRLYSDGPAPTHWMPWPDLPVELPAPIYYSDTYVSKERMKAMATIPIKAVHGNVQAKNDNVNHPGHYTAGKVECIDALEAATEGLVGIEAICTANTIKYMWRWKRKNGLEDLKKAKWYLTYLIQKVEGKKP